MRNRRAGANKCASLWLVGAACGLAGVLTAGSLCWRWRPTGSTCIFSTPATCSPLLPRARARLGANQGPSGVPAWLWPATENKKCLVALLVAPASVGLTRSLALDWRDKRAPVQRKPLISGPSCAKKAKQLGRTSAAGPLGRATELESANLSNVIIMPSHIHTHTRTLCRLNFHHWRLLPADPQLPSVVTCLISLPAPVGWRANHDAASFGPPNRWAGFLWAGVAAACGRKQWPGTGGGSPAPAPPPQGRAANWRRPGPARLGSRHPRSNLPWVSVWRRPTICAPGASEQRQPGGPARLHPTDTP